MDDARGTRRATNEVLSLTKNEETAARARRRRRPDGWIGVVVLHDVVHRFGPVPSSPQSTRRSFRVRPLIGRDPLQSAPVRAFPWFFLWCLLTLLGAPPEWTGRTSASSRSGLTVFPLISGDRSGRAAGPSSRRSRRRPPYPRLVFRLRSFFDGGDVVQVSALAILSFPSRVLESHADYRVAPLADPRRVRPRRFEPLREQRDDGRAPLPPAAAGMERLSSDMRRNAAPKIAPNARRPARTTTATRW